MFHSQPAVRMYRVGIQKQEGSPPPPGKRSLPCTCWANKQKKASSHFLPLRMVAKLVLYGPQRTTFHRSEPFPKRQTHARTRARRRITGKRKHLRTEDVRVLTRDAQSKHSGGHIIFMSREFCKQKGPKNRNIVGNDGSEGGK